MDHQNYTIDNQPVFSLIAEEDNSTHEIESRRFQRRRPGLYPSEASVEFKDGSRRVVQGKCMRAAWYRSSNVPKPPGTNVGLMMKAYLGKQAEVMQVRKWKEMGIWVDNNIKFFDKDLVLSGELDAILRNPMTDKLMGLEMKTFYGYPAGRGLCGIKRERGSGKFLPGKPKVEHFLQSSLYAWEYKDVLDEYRLYYLERGDGHRVEFKVGFTERNDGKHQCYWQQIPGRYWNAYQEDRVLQPYTIEDIHSRYRDLIKMLRKKQLPVKDFCISWDKDTIEYKYSQSEISKTNYDKWVKNPKTNKLGDWQCSYCDYKDQCQQDDLTA